VDKLGPSVSGGGGIKESLKEGFKDKLIELFKCVILSRFLVDFWLGNVSFCPGGVSF